MFAMAFVLTAAALPWEQGGMAEAPAYTVWLDAAEPGRAELAMAVTAKEVVLEAPSPQAAAGAADVRNHAARIDRDRQMAKACRMPAGFLVRDDPKP